jgi:hypothetical protein
MNFIYNSGCYEEFYLLGYNAVYSVESQPTTRILSIYPSIYLSIFVPDAPTWSTGHLWNASFHFSFLHLGSR